MTDHLSRHDAWDESGGPFGAYYGHLYTRQHQQPRSSSQRRMNTPSSASCASSSSSSSSGSHSRSMSAQGTCGSGGPPQECPQEPPACATQNVQGACGSEGPSTQVPKDDCGPSDAQRIQAMVEACAVSGWGVFFYYLVVLIIILFLLWLFWTIVKYLICTPITLSNAPCFGPGVVRS